MKKIEMEDFAFLSGTGISHQWSIKLFFRQIEYYGIEHKEAMSDHRKAILDRMLGYKDTWINK